MKITPNPMILIMIIMMMGMCPLSMILTMMMIKLQSGTVAQPSN